MMQLVLVSHDTTGISISVTKYQHHHKWYHYFLYVKTIEMKCNMSFGHVTQFGPALHNANSIINGTIAFLGSRQLK